MFTVHKSRAKGLIKWYDIKYAWYVMVQVLDSVKRVVDMLDILLELLSCYKLGPMASVFKDGGFFLLSPFSFPLFFFPFPLFLPSSPSFFFPFGQRRLFPKFCAKFPPIFTGHLGTS